MNAITFTVHFDTFFNRELVQSSKKKTSLTFEIMVQTHLQLVHLSFIIYTIEMCTGMFTLLGKEL